VGFAWALFNGYQHAVGGLVIRLAVTPALALTGIGFALALGAIGGLFPAARAARMPIVDALRAV
jgi:putative ABC transport system permease protein